MYQALYRKWRPQTFSDVVGQEHITSVLQYQVQSGRTSHAYLFCGSRGTGKTTCAKLLAKAVNCTNLKDGNPCNECESCLAINSGTSLDVVELDAASNNRVDDIRRLCDEVVFQPVSMKKRVYIVDEVHMLTTQAFNALLKTLEEPPEHAVFILATTELQKVPATIVSRCQRFDFSRIRRENIIDRLMYICSAEGINMERDAAVVIANLSDGAMRDALSLLESCASKGAFITAEYVTNLLGLSNREQLVELIYSCTKQNTTRALALLEQLYTKNGDLSTCFAELLNICKDILIIQNVSSPTVYINVSDDEFKRLSDIANTVMPEVINYFVKEIESFLSTPIAFGMNKKAAAEIAVIKMTLPSSVNSFESLDMRLAQLENKLDGAELVESAPKAQARKSDTPKKEKPKSEPVSKPKPVNNREVFEHVNEFIREFGQRQPMTQFFMQTSLIKKTGSVLKIITNSIGASTMNMSGSPAIALEVARTFDDTIESVEIVGSDDIEKEISTQNDDLSEFEN